MIKKIIKRMALLLIIAIVLAGAFAAHEWNAKPFYINNYFNRFALKIALDSPETLTSLHFLEAIGIGGHNADLDDASPQSTDDFFNYIASEYEVLKSYKNADLSEDELMSKRVAEYLFDFAEQARPFRFHNYPVNQLFGIQSNFPTFMQSQHQIKSLEDAEYYIQRLTKLPRKFSESLEGIKLRTELGVIPPRFVIERVVEEMTIFSSTNIEDNILYSSLKERLDKLEDVDTAAKNDILAQAKLTISEEVYPAYVELTRYFNGLSDKADDSDGFWKLPNGERAYQLALKFFTSTSYTPEYIHNAGLEEVARIQQEILTILDSEGFDITLGFSHAIDLMSKQERFYYPDTDKGREQILADYQLIIDEIEIGLSNAFNVKPKAKVEVARIPLFKEKTSPGAYYNSPALDGSRPGIFYANLYDIKATPKYSMRTLAYHEAIPGHHFQRAVAQELEDLPIFRKFAPFTAYSEGWALYAERVAWELGFQNNPYDNIGRLQAELFRAVRLVVDTGLHAKRWPRQKAIEYMIANTGMAESDVVSEIERYIVMPGQACAYKVGMMKILELRTKAKNSLGDRFNLASFHDVILKNGPVPLDLLEELVDTYIEKQK
jgi:uncharacterized protein (DUF885 family)